MRQRDVAYDPNVHEHKMHSEEDIAKMIEMQR